MAGTNNKINIKDLMDDRQKMLSTMFTSAHWLANQKHVEQFLMVNTFYRRNLHRFARDYFNLHLYWYQMIILYLMGISNFIVIIASRAAAKSFVIAIYACCKAVLYPGSQVVLTSGTRGQSKLIVTKKIQGELMERSANLRREIVTVKDNQNEVVVKFRNGSTITTVTCSKTARGNRSTVNVGEEAREIDKSIMDTVISPFQVVRQVPFMTFKEYRNNELFKEEPTEIYISSSMEESHWLYKTAIEARDGMFKDNGSFFVAFDYSITLKHGIRTRKQLVRERRKIDPLTFKVEYENAVLRTNSNAFFQYDLIKDNCVLKRAFYPRRNEDVIARQKNKYSIAKQQGEVRIVSCDIAAVDRNGNDNSAYCCLRLFPEVVEYDASHKSTEFRIQMPYIEGFRGVEARRQAIRIRQLFEDFEADYIVLDARSFGTGVYDSLARVLYDDERGVEYSPFKCMNDDAFANRIQNPNAEARIYCVAASSKLNNDMVINLKSYFTNHKLDLLVSKDEGVEEITRNIPEYTKYDDAERQLYFEKPYLETMLLRKELLDLTYEKMPNTGLIKIHEPTDGVKDRFSCLEMGVWFALQLSLDMLGEEEETKLNAPVFCVSAL